MTEQGITLKKAWQIVSSMIEVYHETEPPTLMEYSDELQAIAEVKNYISPGLARCNDVERLGWRKI